MSIIFPTHYDPFTGENRILNLQRSQGAALAAATTWSESLPLSEIQPFDAWPSVVLIKDQNGRGACTGHAAVSAAEALRVMSGMPHVPLSAWWVYSILCRGWDVGCNILDALKLISSQGIAPESLVEYGIINPNRLTQAARAAAPNYRVEIGSSLKSWEEILSAVALGRFLDLSICVGDDFSSLDSEGVPVAYQGPGNHAVCVGGGIKKSKKWGWLVKMANSWSTRWGWNGFCWLAEKHIESSTWFECLEVRGVVTDPNQINRPPRVA